MDSPLQIQAFFLLRDIKAFYAVPRVRYFFPFMPTLRLYTFLALLAPLCLFGGSSPSLAATIKDVEFRADHYERNFQSNTIRGKGHAWLQKGSKQLWADELEVDFSTNRAIARGAVHIRDGAYEIWARYASYQLDSEEAILEDATVINGKLVMTGNVIRRLDAQRFEIEEGTYSNCNVDLVKDQSASQCSFDWKVFGSHISATIEAYAHVRDAIVYVKDLPAVYIPYFMLPIKTSRTSGVLLPSFTYSENLGSGTTVPYFLVLGPWQDLTFYPTYYSKTGYHLGVDYRYLYSRQKFGEAKFFLLQRRFSADRNSPGPDDTSRNRSLGFIGEWGIDIRNRFETSSRTFSLQVLRFVSDPYYTIDHRNDFQLGYDAPSLRSQISFTTSDGTNLFTAQALHHQSLVMPKDAGVDRGAVTALPQLSYSRLYSPLLDRYFAFEFDTTVANYYRPAEDYDSVSLTLNSTDSFHSDPNGSFHFGDYLRVGRRWQIEPRLIAQIPLHSGIQVQPVVRTGSLVYHFNTPTSNVVHREYVQYEIPASLYFSRRYEPAIAGYEKIHHVFQPRFVYAKTAYQSDTKGHPFFFKDGARGLSNPGFDVTDQMLPFEYMRFELINRFRRQTPTGVDRFFLLQLSEQYNLTTLADDPRFARRLGPIELLSEFTLGPIYGQLQGNYQLENTQLPNGDAVRENDISSLLEYRPGSGDRISLGNRLRINVDEALTEKTVLFSFYKVLPTFIDVEGGLEYSYKRGDLLGARLGLVFASKPRSCWGLTLTVGQDDLKRKFLRFLFRLDFGGAYNTTLG